MFLKWKKVLHMNDFRWHNCSLSVFRQKPNIPAKPPVAADSPKWPYLGRITFSARIHISKSCSLFVIPFRNKTCKQTQNVMKIYLKRNIWESQYWGWGGNQLQNKPTTLILLADNMQKRKKMSMKLNINSTPLVIYHIYAVFNPALINLDTMENSKHTVRVFW